MDQVTAESAHVIGHNCFYRSVELMGFWDIEESDE
jgi:hypothetical protein